MKLRESNKLSDMKVFVQYWMSENEFRIRQAKLKGFTIKIGKETFECENVKSKLYIKPGIIGGQKGYPFYIVNPKISKAIELDNKVPEKMRQRYVTPTSYAAMLDNKVIETAMKIKKKVQTVDFFMFIVIGLAIGYLLGSQIPLGSLLV